MATEALASRLKDRVTIQEKDLVDNGRGGRKERDPAVPWKDVATSIAAEVIPLRGGEAVELSVQRSTQLYRVTIRARRGITPAMRVIWQDAITGEVAMNIRSAAPNEKRDGLVMTCESGVAA